jgi:hypothetical protein
MGFNTGPGPSNAIPPGEDFMMREIRDLQRYVRELGPSVAKSFQPVIDRLDATDADLIAKQATLDAQQATLTTAVADLTTAEATLATTVSGLSAAVADIATLVAKQSAFDSNGNSTTNFAIGTTVAAKASMTVPIPAGFTRALVHATVDASVQNTSAAFDYVYVATLISAPGQTPATGGEAFDGLAPGEWGNAGASGVTDFSGLTPGDSITVQCRVRSGGGTWAAAASNRANVNASVVFLR